MLKRSQILAGAAVLAAGAFAIVVFTAVFMGWGSHGGRISDPLAVQSASPARIEEKPPDGATHGLQTQQDPVVGMDEVRSHCTGRVPEWTEACRRALDAYFMPQPLPNYDNIPPVAPTLFADVLESVGENRETVIAVLSMPECRLDEDILRSDLYERCHAETIMHYASFLHVCAANSREELMLREDHYDFEYRRPLQAHIANVQAENYVSHESYVHAIEEAEKDFYRAGWRATTCRKLLEKHAPPDEVTGSGFAINMGLFTSASLDSGYSFLKRRELFRQGYAGDDAPEFDLLLKGFCHDEYEKLTAFAARLGHESAQFQWHTELYIYHRHEGSPEYLEGLQQENPLLWHFRHTLTRLGLEVEERVRHAVIAEKLARAQGRTVDVSHVFIYTNWREFTSEKQERVRAEGLEEFRRLYGDP